jgi:hypothetical protein
MIDTVKLPQSADSVRARTARTSVNTVGRAYAFVGAMNCHAADIRHTLNRMKAVPDMHRTFRAIGKTLKQMAGNATLKVDGIESLDELDMSIVDSTVKIPNHARFSVYYIAQVYRGSPAISSIIETPLATLAEEWRRRGANHFMRAFLPRATNQETAMLLDRIIVNIDFHSMVFKTSQEPVWSIYFRDDNGRYTSMSQSQDNTWLKDVSAALGGGK